MSAPLGQNQNQRVYEFHIVVHEAEEGGYWGEVLDLPGCMSQGETEAELYENLKDAIRAVLTSYARDGEAPPLERHLQTRTLQLAVPL